ncbi:MAG: transposase, partial [Nannocystis sp.]
GLYVHLHCLVTDGVYEEQGGELRFLPAPPPTPERMTAVLAQVHEVVRAADDDLDIDIDIDPALAACVQLSLAGPHLASGSQPAAPSPMTVSAFGMNLHAATTADGRDRKQLERICRYLLRPRGDVFTTLRPAAVVAAQMDLCMVFQTGSMGQVERPRARPCGASWGRLGIDKPLGLRSLLG